MSIDKYIGLPYRNLGRDESGVDCFGLVRLFYRDEFDIELPSLVSEYSDAEDGSQTGEVVITEIENRWYEVDTPKHGDVVVFKMMRMATHIGVVLNDSTFLHAIKGRNVCVERLSNVIWKNRVFGYFHLRGMA